MTTSTTATLTPAVESIAAAPMIGVSAATLKMWRRKKIGPPYVRFGNRVRYRVSDLDAWLAAHTVTVEPAALD